MKKPTLLILAAGIGSRYGGLKQIDSVGPGGETIIDYSVYDAIRAGFGKLVFVIRRDIERPFREIIGSRFESRLPVEYAFQELDKLPAGFAPPPGRQKPWGTGHAVLVASELVHEPFGVINGDDFYGRTSLQLLADHLRSGSADFAMIGFTLKNTLSDFGAVARGVCEVSSDGYLRTATELTRIQRDGQAIKHTGSDGQVHPLTGDEVVSLNTWAFTPAIFPELQQQFVNFLKSRLNEEKAEFFIPTVVNNMISTGHARFKVLRTPDSWFGVTYREDRPRVVESIGELVAHGEYPPGLWEDSSG